VDDLLVAFVTVGGEEQGRDIARTIVSEGLAACVNVIPRVRSIYRWEGSIQEDEESLLIIKTGKGVLDALKRRVREIHPYQLPELIAVEIEAGLEEYMTWVDGQLKAARPGGEKGSG
jgi:periplasmic divalent cation tolerance protein